MRRAALWPSALALLAACADDRVGVIIAGEGGAPRLTACADTADTEDERRVGLLGRGALAAGEGLLLAFPVEGEACITGAGMRFAIDAVYASKDGRVVAVERFAADDPRAPCHDRVWDVLEVAGGSAAAVQPGDVLSLVPGCGGLP